MQSMQEQWRRTPQQDAALTRQPAAMPRRGRTPRRRHPPVSPSAAPKWKTNSLPASSTWALTPSFCASDCQAEGGCAGAAGASCACSAASAAAAAWACCAASGPTGGISTPAARASCRSAACCCWNAERCSGGSASSLLVRSCGQQRVRGTVAGGPGAGGAAAGGAGAAYLGGMRPGAPQELLPLPRRAAHLAQACILLRQTLRLLLAGKSAHGLRRGGGAGQPHCPAARQAPRAPATLGDQRRRPNGWGG